MQPLHPTPPRQRHVWMWAGGVAGLGLAITSFLGAQRPHIVATPNRPATGTFAVTGAVVLGTGTSFSPDDDGGCAGTGSHAGVRDAAPVLLAVGDGTVATGQLRDGQTLTDGTCRFWFAVKGVPAGQSSYLLWVADEDARQYPEQELHGPLVTLRLD